MHSSLPDILASYNDQAPLDHARTIPAPWYTHEGIAQLEREQVFGRTWHWSGANLVWGLTALAISRLVLANSLAP